MKSLITTIVCVAVLALLAITNPKMIDYQEFVHGKIIRKSEQADAISKTLGLLFGGIESGLVANATKRTDYVFFSIYETKLRGDDIKYLGIFNNFVVLKELTDDAEDKRTGQ